MSAASESVRTPPLASPATLRAGGEERFSGAVRVGTVFEGSPDAWAAYAVFFSA